MANQHVVAVNQVNDYLQNPSNPYYLHPNENPSLVLVSTLLNEKNYHPWARAMKMALLSKNKYRFVDGTLPAPPIADPMRVAWQRCNTTVSSWITRSLSPSIAQSIIWIDSAAEIWKDLQERFSQGDIFRISDLSKLQVCSGSGADGSCTFSFKTFIGPLKREDFPPVATTSWGTHWFKHLTAGALDLTKGRCSDELRVNCVPSTLASFEACDM